jgi:hypothetical protein
LAGGTTEIDAAHVVAVGEDGVVVFAEDDCPTDTLALSFVPDAAMAVPPATTITTTPANVANHRRRRKRSSFPRR